MERRRAQGVRQRRWRAHARGVTRAAYVDVARRVGLGLVVLALGACARAPAPSPRPPVEDRQLAAAQLEGEGWRARRDGSLELPEGGADGATLRLPGPFDLRFATHLHFELRAQPELALTLRAAHRSLDAGSADGQERWPMELTSVWPESAWVPVGIEVPPSARRAVESLELAFSGDAVGGGLELRELRIVQGPPAGWARALAEGNAELLELDGDAREGHVLWPGQIHAFTPPPHNGPPRSSAGSMGGADDAGPARVLTFTVGFWSPGNMDEVPVALVLRDASGNVLARLSNQQTSDAGTGAAPSTPWHTRRVSLGAGDHGPFAFHLESDAPLLAGVAEVAVFRPEPRPPSVLLITSDTHRGDHVGVAGDLVRTPALDTLAERGLTFLDCFATTNVTVPSHAALMTGVHPRDSGVSDNQSQLGRRAATLAEAFRSAGYMTLGCTSINLLDPGSSGLGQGFQRFAAAEQRREASASIEQLQAWLPDLRDRPVFAWLHLFDAHAPYGPPERMTRLYWPPEEAEAPQAPSIGTPSDDAARIPDWVQGTRDVDYVRALYRGTVSYLDYALSPLLHRGRFKRGVVAFTADHGECLGDHDVWWAHKGVYPDTLHVPLLLQVPGVQGGQRFERPVRQLDLGRTLLDAVGLEALDFPGRNLLREPDEPGESGEWDESLGSEARFALEAKELSASVTQRGWHLIRYLEEHRRGRAGDVVPAGHEELFDLRDDPGADRDLAGTQPERRAELAARLDAWLAERQDLGLLEQRHVDPETLRRLAELGYADDDG